MNILGSRGGFPTLNSIMLTDTEWFALLLSAKVACAAVLCSLPIGIFIAWILVRKQFFGKKALEVLVYTPLVLPPVVVGYLLLLTFGRNGWLGSWLFDVFGFSIAFRWQGAVLASAVVSFPLMVRAIRLSVEGVDRKIEDAARTLGASRWKVFRTISLPLIAPGIVSGALLAFARSLGEFGATIAFVSNIPRETQTIPLAMFTFLDTPGAEMAAARLCLISVLLAVGSVFASEWIHQRTQATS